MVTAEKMRAALRKFLARRFGKKGNLCLNEVFKKKWCEFCLISFPKGGCSHEAVARCWEKVNEYDEQVYLWASQFHDSCQLEDNVKLNLNIDEMIKNANRIKLEEYDKNILDELKGYKQKLDEVVLSMIRAHHETR